MRHSSLSLRERSQGEEWLSRATHSCPWVTLACVTRREWGFGEADWMECLSLGAGGLHSFCGGETEARAGLCVRAPPVNTAERGAPGFCFVLGALPWESGASRRGAAQGWKERDGAWP